MYNIYYNILKTLSLPKQLYASQQNTQSRKSVMHKPNGMYDVVLLYCCWIGYMIVSLVVQFRQVYLVIFQEMYVRLVK